MFYKRKIMKKIVLAMLMMGISAIYAADFDGMLTGSDSVNKIMQQANGKCLQYRDVTIVTQQDSDMPGEQVLVKNAPDVSCEWQSESNWSVDSGVASYFKGISSNWLFIDRGTSTDNRDILVYNATTHDLVLSDTYAEPIRITDNKLQYWRNIGDTTTSANCDKYDEAQKLGLSTQLQALVNIDLSTPDLKIIKSSERRCQMTQ